jgi:3',5'-cyclic AMP phosphodiesterase CpdA
MIRIAHLSDLHLVEPDHAARRGLLQRRLAYLTFGRPVDAERRKRRVLDTLVAARRSGADHVLITGDLTEDGMDAQFDVLAEVLTESRLSPRTVTLLPGNHDAYNDGGAYDRALRGPLSAFAPTSTPGVPVFLGDTVILPMSTAFHQPFTRAIGRLDELALGHAAALADRTRATARSLVLAMHHPPQRRLPVVQWIDGLEQHAAVGSILERHDHVSVLFGHIHGSTDRAVRPGATPRIFSCEAVVDGSAPLRLYNLRHGRVCPILEPRHAAPAMAIA